MNKDDASGRSSAPEREDCEIGDSPPRLGLADRQAMQQAFDDQDELDEWIQDQLPLEGIAKLVLPRGQGKLTDN